MLLQPRRKSRARKARAGRERCMIRTEAPHQPSTRTTPPMPISWEFHDHSFLPDVLSCELSLFVGPFCVLRRASIRSSLSQVKPQRSPPAFLGASRRLHCKVQSRPVLLIEWSSCFATTACCMYEPLPAHSRRPAHASTLPLRPAASDQKSANQLGRCKEPASCCCSLPACSSFVDTHHEAACAPSSLVGQRAP